MYTHTNFRSKKALKEAFADGCKISVFQPGPFGRFVPRDGTVTIEGPHYPEPHKFYCCVDIKNGIIVKIR